MSKWQQGLIGSLLLASVIVDFKYMLLSVASDSLFIGLAVWFGWYFSKQKGKKQ